MRAESYKYDDQMKEHPMTWLHSNTQEVKNPKNMIANKRHNNNSITICNHDRLCIIFILYHITTYAT